MPSSLLFKDSISFKVYVFFLVYHFFIEIQLCTMYSLIRENRKDTLPNCIENIFSIRIYFWHFRYLGKIGGAT
jgi:hypothetical protein